MARGINKVTILGNVGQDPESRDVGSTSVTNFSIATSESWTKDGEKHEKTEWHNVTAWGKLADIVSQYVHKGSKLYIEGKLQTRKWEKDGQTHYSTDIIASEVLMLDSKGESGYSQPEYATPPSQNNDNDLPFS